MYFFFQPLENQRYTNEAAHLACLKRGRMCSAFCNSLIYKDVFFPVHHEVNSFKMHSDRSPPSPFWTSSPVPARSLLNESARSQPSVFWMSLDDSCLSFDKILFGVDYRLPPCCGQRSNVTAIRLIHETAEASEDQKLWEVSMQIIIMQNIARKVTLQRRRIISLETSVKNNIIWDFMLFPRHHPSRSRICVTNQLFILVSSLLCAIWAR